MNTTQPGERDILKTVFDRMPEEALPQTFIPDMMQQIRKEAVRIRKRDERLRIVALVAASLAIVGLAAAALLYTGIPQMKIEFPRITIPPSYIFIGILALVLLLADSLFRQNYYKKHPERV
jgi:polyferredoxin